MYARLMEWIMDISIALFCLPEKRLFHSIRGKKCSMRELSCVGRLHYLIVSYTVWHECLGRLIADNESERIAEGAMLCYRSWVRCDRLKKRPLFFLSK